MNKRPIAVTVVAGLFIAAGVFGSTVHFRELAAHKPFNLADLGIPMVSLLPVLFGVFLLLGHNWARWIALIWMAFHVAISFFDSLEKVAVHSLLLAVIAYALFRADAKAYFRQPEKAGLD